jgi:amylosucrase
LPERNERGTEEMQNRLHMKDEARAAHGAALDAAQPEIEALLPRDRGAFLLRLERYWQDLHDGLLPPYGARSDFDARLADLVRLLAASFAARPEDLKLLDLERNLTPDWFQSEKRIGYVFYVDRFAGDLKGVADRLDYLEELGADYVHLMPLLKPRPAPNDGGYAVEDYLAVEPALGTMEDLEALCDLFRQRGISVCLDLVLNHCADTHEWTRKARRGDPRYASYFHAFPDRTMPDAYEHTLPEVFPETAPGNFTYVQDWDRWVWTTFNEYQWDLNWSEPRVFLEMTGILLALANKGVEVFRLDAVAFMWKRLGTNCQNQPEVHDLLQALRACSRISAAAVVHKAEAIVGPDELVTYLGTHAHHGKESDLAYHNALMVHLWSALASRDTRLMTHALGRFPHKPPNTSWATYARGHDDIGWAILDEDAAAVGLDAHGHRAFLSSYYSGDFPGSHALGLVFEENEETGDKRISGSFASLAGLELALETDDPLLLEMSLRRILLGHALILGFGGVPLIFMGDELGLPNDPSYLKDPDKADDNRWVHRPRMDWEAAARRHEPGTTQHRLFRGLQAMVHARKHTPHLHAVTTTEVFDTGNPRVFAFLRPHPLGPLVALHNFTESDQYVGVGSIRSRGLHGALHDRLGGGVVEEAGGSVRLAPYGSLWLSSD